MLNLPLRPPAVMARAAASLDLLSGGRFELGLGAGGFWDGVVAIDAIRGVWDQGDRARFEVDGEYHRVSGANRGPAPAHNIPIWLGAYKPRMLRLTGRKADGWLPSLGYFKPGELRHGNVTIDAAAAELGHDVGWAQLAFQVSDTAAFLEGWGAAMEAAPREVTTSRHRSSWAAHGPASRSSRNFWVWSTRTILTP